jgi:hypothetical protein
MSRTRRKFMKEIAVAGAAITTGTVIVTGQAKAGEPVSGEGTSRCPYFDQPMYCKDLTPNGKPMCDQK